MLFSFFVGFLVFSLGLWRIELDFMHCSFDKYNKVNLLSINVRFYLIELLKLKLQNGIPLIFILKCKTHEENMKRKRERDSEKLIKSTVIIRFAKIKIMTRTDFRLFGSKSRRLDANEQSASVQAYNVYASCFDGTQWR